MTKHKYYYNGYDWERPSKAVVASDGKGSGAVLWTIGAHVNYIVQEELGYMDLGDLGLDSCPLGVHIWEGHSEIRHHDSGEDDWLELVGKFRLPTLTSGKKLRLTLVRGLTINLFILLMKKRVAPTGLVLPIFMICLRSLLLKSFVLKWKKLVGLKKNRAVKTLPLLMVGFQVIVIKLEFVNTAIL